MLIVTSSSSARSTNIGKSFLGGATALLFPIDWPEPFGLVMIEAMACGTPVIAFRCGSVSEIVEENVSGFVVDSVKEAVAAIRRVANLDRAKVRAEFERRFTVERMARDYLALYRKLLSAHSRPAQFGTVNGSQEGWHAVASSRLGRNSGLSMMDERDVECMLVSRRCKCTTSQSL
jgi:Glycosyl transferases group 1